MRTKVDLTKIEKDFQLINCIYSIKQNVDEDLQLINGIYSIKQKQTTGYNL